MVTFEEFLNETEYHEKVEKFLKKKLSKEDFKKYRYLLADAMDTQDYVDSIENMGEDR